MPIDDPALLNVDSSENIPPSQAQRLSRSPHPYHRQGSSLLQDDENLLPRSTAAHVGTSKIVTAQETSNTRLGATYFDADPRKRRKQCSSPSDSGTEADDERGAILLGLPPPPNRLRKGLKGANNAGTASPLLTPSYLDEESRRSVLKARSSRRASLQRQTTTDEETAKLREKFRRRRQAELIRRTSETVLIAAVGFIASKGDVERVVHMYAYESVRSLHILDGHANSQIPLALSSHAAVLLTLYVLYPLRIIHKNHALSASKNRSRFYIHIPAAFEPAPLLYPVLVPIFVALSLLHTNTAILLPNLILSVASVPSKVVPFNADVPWYSSIQWLLSALPVLASRMWLSPDNQCSSREGLNDVSVLDDENLLLLYPLHQALLPVLGSLTTTSLLPAELQLLSVSMINLLLYAESPQSIILQALLWIGGLSIFAFCGKVLTWGVALARIPSWRFRKHYTKACKRNVLICATDDCFHGYLSKWGLISPYLSDSDDSGDGEVKLLRTSERRKHRQMLSVDTRRGRAVIGGQRPNNAQVSSVQDVNQPWVLRSNDRVEALGFDLDYKRQRRSTLPSYIGSTPADVVKEPLKRSRTTQYKPPKSWSLRSFTEAQAILVKWALALYVYVVTAVVIAFVIRTYVGRNALHGQEPVGWALSYLLGDIPLIRHSVINWDLDYWIHLPKDVSSYQLPHFYSLAHLRDSFGAANVRLLICGYCVMIIIVGLMVVFRLSAVAEVDTRRKVFHGMVVAMFLPTIFVDPAFISLAFALILAIFLLLDLFRASQLPPLSRPLTHFLAPYVDGRDHRGPVIVSHIFLLIGCAIPLWLSLAAVKRTGEWPWEGWDVERRELGMISGVVCVGMGDAAASLVGRRYGRRRWCWSGGKSLEGSLAFAVAVVLGLTFARLWLLLGGWDGDGGDSWVTTLGKASVAATGASLTEAVLTGGNDNVIVPVILWLLVRGLKI